MDYNQLKVPELKQLLIERGLDAKGRKVDLVNRLVQSDTLQSPSDTPTSTPKASLGVASSPKHTPKNHNGSSITTPATHQISMETSGLSGTQELPELSESERLKRRREKFGVVTIEDEEEKKLQRAQRFSLVTAESEAVKMQHRAARFGTGFHDVAIDSDELNRRRKRAERFGILTSDEDEVKKKQRAERFGLSTSIKCMPDGETLEAKLAARALRFGPVGGH